MSEKKLDKKKFLQRIIIACWIALIVCLIIKLFGGNIFEIICKNQTFIKVCNYVDSHIWADYLVCIFSTFISLYFFTLAIVQEWKYKKWQLIVVIATVLVGTAIKIWNYIAGLVFDVWQFIGMPMLFLGKKWKEYWKILVANVLLVAFQAISIYIKNTDFGELYNSTLVGTIYGIDITIMVILYYGYSNFIKLKIEEKIIKKENEQ